MINIEFLKQYYKSLIGKCFKVLPLYEGKDMYSKQIIYSSDKAFENYQQYLSNLIIEVSGSEIFFNSVNSIEILNKLNGAFKEIGVDEHFKLKPIIMDCISLCNKVISEIEEGDDGGI